jgi:hypothetical protein
MLLAAGVEACIEKKLTAPSLILIYSGIDTAGWLDSEEPYATRSSFMDWVDGYLLPSRPLDCTAVDLYAARCGLLHTMTPDSQLSARGRARRVCYAWGDARAEDIRRTIDVTNKASEYVAVHVEELYEGWRLGLLAFTQEIESDAARQSKVYAKAKQFFSEPPVELLL